MNKIVYVSDFFVEHIAGGAEINDSILLDYIGENHKVIKFQSKEITDKHIKLYINSGFKFLISNFINLNLDVIKELIRNPNKYSIIEHDHKYLRTRNPSQYKDFLAPSKDIINRIFYVNANSIFAQSKIHKEVIEKNLKINNVVNLGMSLWSDEQLSIIERNINNEKKNDCSIIESTNPTKNTKGTVAHCEERNIDYTLIGSPSYEEFIKQLSKHEKYVYVPIVLETLNRVIIEARMLNCKVSSTNLNGCFSEEWFSKLKGSELIEYVREQRDRVVNDVLDGMYQERKTNDTSDITAILNAYRRPYNLKMQVDALKEQTKPPKQIWLWVNDHEDNHGFDFKSLGVDRIFHNDYNWKFYGRFAGALLADTEFVVIYDDDTIPGNRWHENCLNTMKTHEGILGTAGYVQTGPRAMQYEPERSGWPRQNSTTMRVDYVGHAWFFKREWLSHLWREKPPTWHNGEDIHFSYTAQKYGSIQTYCPPHPPSDNSLHGSLLGYELGVDTKATSNNHAVSHQQFFTERDGCIKNSLDGGWKTVHNIKLET
jgi:hypothetical protein